MDHLRPEPPATVEAYLIDRIPPLLRIGYQPGESDAAFVGLTREFIGLLKDWPVWAIAAACDAWVRKAKHRPAPSHIHDLAKEAVEPITTELRQRRIAREEQREHDAIQERRAGFTQERRNEILAEFGFRPIDNHPDQQEEAQQ